METEPKAELGQRRRYIRFGPFQIDQERQQVSRSGTRLKLQGKVYQVLLVLIAKHGQVVTREELKQALWSSDTLVNCDANVNTAVNKLRQSLGDSTNAPAYIETIPRKGYTFLLEPEFATQPFPLSLLVPPNGSKVQERPSQTENSATKSDRWLTAGVIALIIAGMLLGAGLATFWIFRFGPPHRGASSRWLRSRICSQPFCSC